MNDELKDILSAIRAGEFVRENKSFLIVAESFINLEVVAAVKILSTEDRALLTDYILLLANGFAAGDDSTAESLSKMIYAEILSRIDTYVLAKDAARHQTPAGIRDLVLKKNGGMILLLEME